MARKSITRLELNCSDSMTCSHVYKSTSDTKTESILVSSLNQQKKGERIEPVPAKPLHPESVSAGELDQEVDIYGASNIGLEVERTCFIALKTIINMRDDSAGDKTREKLFHYARKVFPVYERWDELYKEAESAKVVERKVIVTVLNGTVKPEDLNGKSDSYVRMGLIHSKHTSERIYLHYNLSAWEKENKTIGKPQNTSVIKNTLTPEWNEQIELKFDDVGSDVLVLEVWDSDGAVDGQEPKKEMEGIREFLHIAHDDFIGRCFFPLSKIAVNGEERSLPLFSHSKKHKRGSIKVKLSIESIRKSSPQEDLLDHQLLMKGLMNAESRTPRGRYKRDWDGTLSDDAKLLLTHHDFLIEINDVQKTAIELNILIRYHRLFGVSVTTFLGLVHTLKGQYELFLKLIAPKEEDPQDLITEDKSPDAADSQRQTIDVWKEELCKDLEELLHESVIGAMRVHITKLQLQDTSSASNYQKFSTYIKVADELSTLPVLVELLKGKKQSVVELVEETIPLGVSDWFLVAKHESKLDGESQTPGPVIEGLEKLCSVTLDMCYVALNRIAPVVLQSAMKIDYFSHFFLAIDKLISEVVITVLDDITESAELDTDEAVLKTFSCYVLLKNIRALGVQPNVSWKIVDPEQLTLPRIYNSFRELVPLWIKEASKECRASITHAIEIETIRVVTDEVKLSSSAVNTPGILRGLFQVRNDLEWPVTIEKMEFTLMLVREAIRCALFYVGDVYMRMKDEYLYDESGQFRASQEMSIILNNMYHVSQVFAQWTDVVPPIKGEEANDETIVEAHTRLSGEISDAFKSFDSEVSLRTSNIVKKIVEKLRPDLERRFKELLNMKEIEMPPDYSNVEEEDIGSIVPLLDYLGFNLQTLALYLLMDVFFIILRDTWSLAIKTISALIGYISKEKKPNRAELHERLYYSLLMLKKFFYSEGRGLTYEVLEDEDYNALVKRLDLLRQPTDKLILKFLSDLASPQERKSLGNLFLTVSYLEDRSLVEVNVLRGIALTAPKPTKFQCYSMLSCFQTFNPYVEISLLPREIFEESSKTTYKTSTQRNTHSPAYNEVIHLPAAKEDLAVDGASLIFTVISHSCGKHYSGMAIIPGKLLIPAEVQPSQTPPTVTVTTATPPTVTVTTATPPTITVTTATQPEGSPDDADTAHTDDPESNDGDEPDNVAEKNFSLPVFAYNGDSAAHAEIMERVKFKDSKAVEFVKQNSIILQSSD